MEKKKRRKKQIKWRFKKPKFEGEEEFGNDGEKRRN